MSVPRRFSILRRKAGLIDLITPIRPESEGVASYRLKKDTDPFGSFTNVVLTAPITGLIDPTVAGKHHVIQPGENVRMLFNPANYTLSDAAFWVRLFYVNASNVELGSPAPGAATLVLPPFVGPIQTGFTATATVKADLANSTQLDLPRAMESIKILNLDGTNPLFVAFDAGGPEMEIPFGKELTGFVGASGQMFVRSTGAGVKFTTTFTYATPR